MRFSSSIGTVVLATVLALSACADAPDPTAPLPTAAPSLNLTGAQQAGGPTAIVTAAPTGFCLDVYGAKRDPGTGVIAYPCHGNENQRFTLPAPNTAGEIRVYGTLCVDAFGAAGGLGDSIVVWPCHGGPNQQWSVTPAGEIKGINGRCLDIRGASGEPLTPVILWDCHGGSNQRWTSGVAGAPAAPTAPAPAPAPAPSPEAAPAPSPAPLSPTGTVGAAELPRARVSADYVVPTGRTITVNAGGDLQAALNAAQSGDQIVLQAGATFIGNFELPNKGDIGQPITVRSSALDAGLPGQGTRVSPANAGAMPKILTPTVSAALRTTPGTRGWQLVGLEIGAAPSAPFVYSLVSFGDVGGGQNSLGQVPARIVLDRSYVHGRDGFSVRRCIALNSASTAVVNSYLEHCHEVVGESQAIAGWNGPGPFRIENNYLEASSEVITLGGSDPSITNLVPSDIEIRRNHITRPMAWQGRYGVKNLIEFKTGQRVLIQGNVLENNWADQQVGFAMLFWSVNADGNAPWTVMQDITIRDNVLRNTAQVINIAAKGGNPSEPTRRISIANNLIYRVGAAALGGGGRGFQILGDVHDVTIIRNSLFATSHATLIDNGTMSNLRIIDNVYGRTDYGIFGGAGAGEGTKALDRYAPGWTLSGNAIVGALASSYPGGNIFPGSASDIGVQSLAAGDYTLGSMGPQVSVNGRPAGVDFAALTAQTAGVVR